MPDTSITKNDGCDTDLVMAAAAVLAVVVDGRLVVGCRRCCVQVFCRGGIPGRTLDDGSSPQTACVAVVGLDSPFSSNCLE